MSSRFFLYDVLGDPRRRCLSLQTRAIFDDLVMLSDRIGNPSIRFADSIPNATMLAEIVACKTVDIEKALKELMALGLVEICRDNAIAIVVLRKAFDRSRINSANGSRGGRPRKRKVTNGPKI